MINNQAEIIVRQILNQDQYNEMQKDIEELEKLIGQFKKFFEEILQKQQELCSTNLELANRKLQKYKNNCCNIIQENIKILGQQSFDLFNNLQNSKTHQLAQLNNYQAENKQHIMRFKNYLNIYILNGLKFYQSQENELKKSLELLKEKQAEYKSALALYNQTQSDPSLLYNFDLKQRRYSNVQHSMKQIKESHYSLQACIEILNSRRKSLCIDLLELKKITEELLSIIIFNTYKQGQRNIGTLLRACQNQSYSQRKILKNSQFSILPQVNKFNFEHGSSRLADFHFIQEQKRMSQQNDNVDEFENQSFHSLRDLDAESTSENEDVKFQLPYFLIYDLTHMSTSQIIQYQEWLQAYVKQIKENCWIINNDLTNLSQFVEAFISTLRKQGKPCIQLPETKLQVSPITQIKWFNQYQQYFGDLGIESLQSQIQINDLFNLFAMQLAVFMKPKLHALIQLQETLQFQQNITFSSIEKQVSDLNVIQQQYLRNQGLVINNRTVSLSSMDSQQKQYYNSHEKQFRNMITTTSKAITHLLLDLDKLHKKTLRTWTEIVHSIHQQIGIQLGDVQQFSGYLDLNDTTLRKHCQYQASILLKQFKSFQILYKSSLHKPNQLLIQTLMDDEYNCVFQFPHHEYQLLPNQSPNQSFTEQSDIEEKFEKMEQDKDYENQLQFIRNRIQVDSNEQFYASFACALAEKIQLQGRLYITNKRLFFHSNFNSSNLFFGDTTLNIPRYDILYIQKRTNAFIFDNSISIKTPKGYIFFATFFARDAAYDLIIKVFSPKEQPELINSANQQVSVNAIKLLPINFTEQQLQLLKERSLRMEQQIQPQLPIFIEETIFPFPEINLRLFFKLIFGDRIQTQSNSFYERMKYQLGTSDLTLSKWVPEPPIEFDSEYGIKSIIDTDEIYERSFSCQQPLPKSSIPLMPKSCGCTEEQKLIFISLNKFALELIVRTIKAPYCDAFYVHVRYICEEVKDGIQMQCYIENVFVKSVFVQKIIESQSISEIKSKTNQYIFPSIRKELQNYVAMINGTQVEEEEPEKNQGSKENEKKNQKWSQAIFRKLKLTLFTGIIIAFFIYLYINILSKLSIEIKYSIN